jgi:anti-sigma B factor antagonist
MEILELKMDALPLEITTRTEETGLTVLELNGRLDVLTCKDLAASLQDSMDAGHKDLALELSQLEYVSSAGLRVLLQARKNLKGIGGSLALCGAGDFVQEILRTTGFTTIFPCHATTAEAAPQRNAST